MKHTPTLRHTALPHRCGKRMAYWLWGEADAAHTVVFVHGLTRQGRDFDVVIGRLLDAAQTSGRSLRVVSVDVLGRGQSDWLDETNAGDFAGTLARWEYGYTVPCYAQDMAELLRALHAHAAIERMDWVGTSMGGLIGMAVLGGAALGMLQLPVNATRLVLNDIGPVLEWTSIARIGSYLNTLASYHSEQEAAQAIWRFSSTFGPHTEQEWMALCRHQLKQTADGSFVSHYDPAIAVPFKEVTQQAWAAGEATMWRLYEAIPARTLITRGAVSDLLSRATCVQMQERGVKMPSEAQVVEFEGVGHAPTYVDAAQSRFVVDFLLGA